MSICLRRREFIAGLGGAAAWPLAAHAQQGERVRRIGVLAPGVENDPGYAEGRNVAIEYGLTSGINGLGRNIRSEDSDRRDALSDETPAEGCYRPPGPKRRGGFTLK